MPLVLTGTVVPFDTTESRSAAIYVDGNGRIETVQGPAATGTILIGLGFRLVTERF